MDLLGLMFHLLGFFAPAFFLALVMPLAARVVFGRRGGWVAESLVVLVACVGVLVAGLWFFGRDGKMATYALLVLAGASVQWVAVRGWK